MVLLARCLLGNVSYPPLSRWYLPPGQSANGSVVYDLKSGDYVVIPCPDTSVGRRGIQHARADREFCRFGDYVDCCGECDCEGCRGGGDRAGEFVGRV